MLRAIIWSNVYQADPKNTWEKTVPNLLCSTLVNRQKYYRTITVLSAISCDGMRALRAGSRQQWDLQMKCLSDQMGVGSSEVTHIAHPKNHALEINRWKFIVWQHDDIMTWKHLHHRRGNDMSPVNSPNKGPVMWTFDQSCQTNKNVSQKQPAHFLETWT